MAESDEEKKEAQKSVIHVTYPLDSRDIPTHYCNHIQVYVAANDVYLDLMQLQPQTMKPLETDRNTAKEIQAVVVARVVITRAHAERVAEVLRKQLEMTKKTVGAQK